MFVAAGPRAGVCCSCMNVSGEGWVMLRQGSWFLTPVSLLFSQATDTPEDRNNPVLLYNKMELGDLNANFTLEVESGVKQTNKTLWEIAALFFFLKSCFNTFLIFSPKEVWLELLYSSDNEHSEHQCPWYREGHQLLSQLLQETQPSIGQIHQKVAGCFLTDYFLRMRVCGGETTQQAVKTPARLYSILQLLWLFSLNILPFTGIYRTTWCGALLWTWWSAWAELIGIPGKLFERYTAENRNHSWSSQRCHPGLKCFHLKSKKNSPHILFGLSDEESALKWARQEICGRCVIFCVFMPKITWTLLAALQILFKCLHVISTCLCHCSQCLLNFIHVSL